MENLSTPSRARAAGVDNGFINLHLAEGGLLRQLYYQSVAERACLIFRVVENPLLSPRWWRHLLGARHRRDLLSRLAGLRLQTVEPLRYGVPGG